MSLVGSAPIPNVNGSFGWTNRDQYLTNLAAQNAIIAQLSNAQSVIQRLQKVVVPLSFSDAVPVVTYQIESLDTNGTIYKMPSIINVAATINISFVNTSQAEVGDTITFMFQTGAAGSLTVNYDNNFYYTHCGGGGTGGQDTLSASAKLVTTFMWDGAQYVNTDDNC